jgi:predicted DNA-binding transcriptional regulator YafY
MAKYDALERITNLVALLLETRSPLSLDAIANELDGQYPVGDAALRGAFERDKAILRDIGVPIDSEVLSGGDAGRTGYRIDRRRYELADLELEPDEQHALQLAVAAARLDDAEFGLLKLGAGGAVRSSVVTNIPQLDALPVLRDAAASRADVTFGYHGSKRTLQPFALLLREGYWYVIGHDLAALQQRTYRVDRIEGEVGMGDAGSFERPEAFDPRAAFPTDPKLIGGAVDARARVRVDGVRAAAVVAELGPEAVVQRHDDGSVEVSVPCANPDAFRSWLFGLGEHGEVLAPPEVRASVVRWLRAMVGVE